MLKLRDYQVDAVNAVNDCLSGGLNRSALIVLPTGVGKEQPLDEPVLTPSGWSKMGEIKTGDYVIGVNGLPLRVVATHPQGMKKVARVLFSDGTSVRCGWQHLWSVQTKDHKHSGLGYKTKTTECIAGDLKYSDGSNKWFVPVVSPVEFTPSPVPIDPYSLGALIGDGSFLYGSVKFSKPDNFIVDRIRESLPSQNTIKNVSGFEWAIQSMGKRESSGSIKHSLRSLGLMGKRSSEKFIPNIYKYNSVGVRIGVLRGLMDTDGTLNRSGSGNFSTSSKALADDVCEIVRSLGGTTRICPKKPSTYFNGGKKLTSKLWSYRITVNLGPINPFLTPLKAPKYKGSFKQGQTKAITGISDDGEAECMCITVDSPDGLYVTSGYTVTHNSIIFAELAAQCTGRTLVVCPMRELIKQAAGKICQATGEYPSIEMAKERSNECEWDNSRSRYVVASKQTLTMQQRGGGPKRYERFKDIGLVVVDEAHLAPTAPMVEMLEFFKDNGAFIVGLTATPNRHDRISLRTIFDDCPYSMSLPQAIKLGWLVSPVNSVVRVKSMDLSCVRIQGGDFQLEGLSKVVAAERTELEIADIVNSESGNLKTVVYCVSVAQAVKLAEILSVRYGKKAEFVCADQKLCTDQRRSEILEDFKSGETNILTNCGVLTTGWDYPELEHIVMARPTKSLSLYQQILGRGTRPLPGVVDFDGSTPESRIASIAASKKPHFKVTDLVDCSLRHKIVTVVDALAGEDMPLVKDRYVQDVLDLGLIDPLERIEQLQRRIAEEEELKKLEEEANLARQRILDEAKKRRTVKAKVEYETIEVDVVDSRTTTIKPKNVEKKGPVALFGKYKGVPLKEIPAPYLKWKLENLKLAPWYQKILTRELSNRG